MSKKAKYLLICIMAIAMAIIMQPRNIARADDIDDDLQKMYETIEKYTSAWKRDPQTGKYYYPVNSESEIWKFLNHPEKAALCDIPNYVLDDITDEELLELVLNYPLLLDTIAYNSFEQGLNAVAAHFKGLQFVLERNLLDAYLDNTTYNIQTISTGYTNAKNYFIKQYSNYKNNDAVSGYDLPIIPTIEIKTPNGTLVDFMIRGEQLEKEDKNAWNEFLKDNYPNATKLREATTNYNCHSYAWHLQTLPNVFWINDPSPYMTDGSYAYVGTSPTANKQKVFYDYGDNAHSGIVTNYKTQQITSKWGEGPLVSHNVYDCPYFYIPLNPDMIVYYK